MLHLQQKESADIEDKEEYDSINDDITVDISYSGVTPEYFEKVDNASNWLMQFYEHKVATTPVHNALYDQALLYKRRTYDDLKLCLLIDVLRCYDGLNHPTSLNSRERLGLLLLLVKMYKPNMILTYEDLTAVPDTIINMDALITYASGCSDEINFPKDTIIISSLLQQADKKADMLYRTLMYRFCEAISEADGVISRSEKEWLMTILRLDDDDVSNDIVIDSIFTRQ